MDYKSAKFSAAYGTAKQLPAPVKPEVAFVGRSNVGKSSLMNALCLRKDLVKVSRTPGKTTTINFFEVDVEARGKGGAFLVDLPGYGFAKVDHEARERWSELMEGYFGAERAFALVVCLVDIRHEAQETDVQMLEYVQARELPYCVVLTKADKLSRQQQLRAVAARRRQLALGADVPVVVTSAESGIGMDDLRRTITAAIGVCRS